LLTKEDWDAVLACVPRVADPLFGKDVEARFQELRKQIEREETVSFQV